MQGLFPWGPKSPPLWAQWRVRLSPAFWQPSSVCLHAGVLYRAGGRGREAQRGASFRKRSSRRHIPPLPLDRNQANVNPLLTARRALPNQFNEAVRDRAFSFLQAEFTSCFKEKEKKKAKHSVLLRRFNQQNEPAKKWYWKHWRYISWVSSPHLQ